MKWHNHMLMAGSCAVLLNLHPAEIAYCMAAAALPDQLERVGGIRVLAHRGLTHELLLWLAPLFSLMFFPSLLPNSFHWTHLDQILFSFHFRTWTFFVPGVLHLSGDILTPGGIQIVGQKVSLRLFRTGQLKEYVVTAMFVVLAGVHMFPSVFL